MRKNNVITMAIVAIALLFTSCGGTKFTEEDMTNLLFKYDKGILAGVNIGDNWDDIKANHNSEFTVREEEMSVGDMIYQLRKDNNDDNMIHVDFELDDAKNVTTIRYSIMLSIDGVEDVSFKNKLKNTIADLFTNKLFYQVTFDEPDIKQWKIKRNGKAYAVYLSSSENTDQKIGHLDIDVTLVK